MKTIFDYWRASTDMVTSDEEDDDDEMTEERYKKLLTDPTCEMQGFIGGWGVKKHMTKDSAKQALRKSLKHKISETILADEVPQVPPVLIEGIAAAIREQIMMYQRKHIAGEQIVLPLIKKLSDEQLGTILKNLETRSGILQGHRIQQLAHMILPELNKINDSIAYITKLKVEILHLWVDIVMHEYMTDKLHLNVEQLIQDVNGEVQYRHGLRGGVASSSAAAVVPAADVQNNCIIS